MTHLKTLSLRQQQTLKFLAVLIKQALYKIFEYELKNYDGWQLWVAFDESNARFIKIEYDAPGIYFNMIQLQQICKFAELIKIKFSIYEQTGVFDAHFFTCKYIEICENWTDEEIHQNFYNLKQTVNNFISELK